ncbi:MAG: ATP-binding region ATPase domain protein [Patescibacteria group bacterium]|jgi:anti-sigma regulatory factor (Ser/Thr protein kinase)|nr:ATP-binding region ATPase domain protein [Patescibacteria group bacterium]
MLHSVLPSTDGRQSDPGVHQFRVTPRPEAVNQARHMVASILAEWGVDEAAKDEFVLVLSEIVTNAVEHVEHSDTWVTLTVIWANGPCLRVCDGSPEIPITPGVAPDWSAEHGRGLFMASVLGTLSWQLLPDGRKACCWYARPQDAESRAA